MPGAGQVYCGKIVRGIAIFLAGLLLDLVAIFSFGLLGIAALIFWLWNIYDAYSLAGGGSKSQPQVINVYNSPPPGTTDKQQNLD